MDSLKSIESLKCNEEQQAKVVFQQTFMSLQPKAKQVGQHTYENDTKHRSLPRRRYLAPLMPSRVDLYAFYWILWIS